MSYFSRAVGAFVTMLLLVGVISCSGSSSSPPTSNLSGTAATGAGIVGTVTIKDATGAEKSADTSADGSGKYDIDVSDMTPPFIVKVVPANGAGPTLYSYSDSADKVVNITSMTDLAMFIANGNAAMDSVYAVWNGSQLTASQVLSAQAVVNANLQAQINAAGLDATVYDFFTTTFNTDGTGIDAVLEAITVDTSSGTAMVSIVGLAGGSVTITADPSFTFDPAIDTSGINLGGGTGGVTNGDATIEANEELATIPVDIAGTYNLTFTELASGSGIADGTVTTFIVGTDGILKIGTDIVLGTPVFRNGFKTEAIWKDTVNGIEYALSALQAPPALPASVFNEINVGGINGGTFYGQYKLPSGGGTGGGTGGSTLGTPVIADDGTGSSASIAAFYRIAVTSVVNPGEISLFDVYLSSSGEAFSSGLGGNLAVVPNSGTANIYNTTLTNSSGQIHLLVDNAFGINSDMRLFDTGLNSYTAYYGLIANKIAEAPFNGGPSTAPTGDFMPQFFADRVGTYSVTAAVAPVAGGDTTFTLNSAYTLAIGSNGNVTLTTDSNTIDLTWSQTTDTYSDGASVSSVTFTRASDPLVKTVTVQFLNGILESVTVAPAAIPLPWRLEPVI